MFATNRKAQLKVRQGQVSRLLGRIREIYRSSQALDGAANRRAFLAKITTNETTRQSLEEEVLASLQTLALELHQQEEVDLSVLDEVDDMICEIRLARAELMSAPSHREREAPPCTEALPKTLLLQPFLEDGFLKVEGRLKDALMSAPSHREREAPPSTDRSVEALPKTLLLQPFLEVGPGRLESPCRLRFLSLGSILFLLLANIWLILRQLNTNPCQPNTAHQHVHSAHQDLNKRVQKEKPSPRTVPKYQIKIYDAREGTERGFNLSFRLGRWDKSRLFKFYDFVSVGRNFTSLSEKFSVCVATQSSIEKLHSIVQVAENWAGPISAALYAAGDDEYFLLHWYLTFLKKCFPPVNLKVSFHLAVPRLKFPTGNQPSNLKELHEKSFDCTEHHIVLKEIIRLRSQETIKWRMKYPYPQNHLRNLARKNCQNENVFLTDIDIIPSRNLAENLNNFLNSPERNGPKKCAYVIPTYELDLRTNFPKNKSDLIRLAKKGLARPFHSKVFIYNQYATNFSRWEAYVDSSEEEVKISHNVTNFEFLYEPFYVASDTVPEHDERFLGYGYTRNTQVYEMFVKGYQFQVLSPVFTIHWGLQGRKGRPSWREWQNYLNRQYFEEFKREVYARYGRDPLKMIRN